MALTDVGIFSKPANSFIILYYKKFLAQKIKFSIQYIRMINLSLSDLKAIAQSRNIRDYQSKSENNT